jgi:hypothetical protein
MQRPCHVKSGFIRPKSAVFLTIDLRKRTERYGACTGRYASGARAKITHTPKDRPEIVDCGKLVETARALRAFVEGF